MLKSVLQKIKVDISRNEYIDADRLPFEIVERKGIGHPDTLCDMIAERASQYYCRAVFEKFGRLAHHWFDKVMLIGGEAFISFGKGYLVKPYQVIFAGKAVLHVGSESIDLPAIQYRACADVLEGVLYHFDAKKDLQIESKITDYQGPGQMRNRYRPQSISELPSIDDEFVSNDCNVCTGFAPRSVLEEMVLFIESYLTNPEFKKKNQDIGVDIKLVGTRKLAAIEILLNLPFIANLIKNREQYLNREKQIQQLLVDEIQARFGRTISLVINPEDGSGRTYLTATGTVADTGDVGVVGRGNRLNGLITPMRSMSIEASSGKNPMDHTGKLYGILAQKIADEIYRRARHPVSVVLTTSKGKPIDDPDEVIVFFAKHDRDDFEINQDLIREIISDLFSNWKDLIKDCIYSNKPLW